MFDRRIARKEGDTSIASSWQATGTAMRLEAWSGSGDDQPPMEETDEARRSDRKNRLKGGSIVKVLQCSPRPNGCRLHEPNSIPLRPARRKLSH